jgi:RHS repeat-associated protein
MRRYLVSILAAFLLPVCAWPQTTGLPPFGSLDQVGLETRNNQDLNILLAIPIMSSPGRNGLDLNFSVVYNSSIWTKQVGTNVWVPNNSVVPPWGWATTYSAGSTNYRTTTGHTRCNSCFQGDGCQYIDTTETINYTYTDPLGTVHSFGGVYYEDQYDECTGTDTQSGTFSGYASDGSGYLIDIDPNSGAIVSLFAKNGFQISPGKLIDPNGNYISSSTNGSETDWTDSAGRVALKVITGTSAIQYEYFEPNGSYQTATMNLESLPIKTAFGCSGVVEYTGTATVPSELDIPAPNGVTLKYLFTYEPSPGNSGYYTGRLQRVTLPTGGYYEYDYTGSNDGINCSDGTTLSMNRKVSDGTNSATWNYVRNTSNLTTTITTPKLADTPNAFDTVVTFNSSGQETERQICSVSPCINVLRTIKTTWATNGTPSFISTILENGTSSINVGTTFDSNGLLDSKTEYLYNSGNPGTPFRTTTFTYDTASSYTNLNILDLVTSKQVKDNSGTVQYLQEIAYDGNGDNQTNCETGVAQHNDSYGCSFYYRGNPSEVSTWLNPSVPSNPVAKAFTYDEFGNLLTAQLNCCQTKTWTYSATTSYSEPDSVQSGTSPGPTITTSATYNSNTGQIVTFTDENGLVTNFSYDTVRRPTSVAQTNGESISYSYNDTNFTATMTTKVDSSKSVQQITSLDTLGRPNLTTTEDGSNNVYSKVSANYDLAGRAYQTSNPFTGTSGSYFTTTQFDVLGRPISITLPDNSATTYSYSLNTATVTDPTGKQRKSVIDAAGRLSSVYEPDPTNNNSLTLQTSYTYNVLDELTQLTQGSQTRSYVYDALGRLESATTPEGGRVCFGTVSGGTCNSNGYDNFDNLLYRTDARGVLTSYGYDGLNRLNSISYNVSNAPGVPATASVGLTYGTNAAQFNNGRLITMTDGVGSENYTYNNLGQLTQLQKLVGTQTFTVGYAYNVANELTQITYPSGRVVQQSVDAIGRLCEIAPSTTGCGTAASPYVSGYGYNTASLVTGLKYGNGIYASFGFSSDRLQLSCLDYSTTNRSGNCTHDSTSKFGLTYAYGAAGSNDGQISGITDYVQSGRSITYTYDSLYRMTNAATTGSASFPAWGLAESYDRYGNRSEQTISSGCTGISCPTNQVSPSATTNRLTDAAYAYDLSGDMTNDGNNTITYDGEGRAVTASGSLGSGTYTYDGNGLRVKKVAGGTTTVYIFSGAKVIAEYQNGAAPTSPKQEYIYAGGALVAKVTSTAIYYYHQDHLSNRLITNSSGGVYSNMGHFPFGESWYQGVSEKWNFTTYEYDSESGNHYAMARYHVSRLGRLSSPDPIAGSTVNPQSLNRYSYSINDPANVTDPSGALANAGCYTSQEKSKDKSQQASGGGPSDADTSDSGTDENGADADPPPQGCVSHVNPWGGGGDYFSDWDAAFGVDGFGLVDGGFVGDASGLVTVYGEGQSDSATTTYALSIEQVCGATTSGPVTGSGVTVNGNCQDFITMGAGPMLGSLIDPIVTGGRTAAAVQEALQALSNPNCASLFGNGVNPVALLTALASGRGISNANLGVTAIAGGIQVDVAVTQAIPSSAGAGGTGLGGASITVNNNPSSPFNAGWTGATLFGAPLSPAYSDLELNATTIIHELGHAANFIYGAGASAILNDAGNPFLSKLNTNFVLKHCF